MARQAVWSLAVVLLIAGCFLIANAQKVDVADSVIAGAKAVSGSDSKQGKRAWLSLLHTNQHMNYQLR
jgi:hypothetical protein